MLIDVFVMCAVLLSNSTGFDCDEKWVVYIYDDVNVYEYCYPGLKGQSISGCAKYDHTRGHSIILASNGTATHTSYDVFLHEVKHLSCLCNYHASPPEGPRR